MRRFLQLPVIVLLLLAVSVPASVFAEEDEAVVIYKKSSCEYMVTRSHRDFAVLEFLGGYEPEGADTLYGDFKKKGLRTFKVMEKNQEARLNLHESGLEEDEAKAKMMSHCEVTF